MLFLIAMTIVLLTALLMHLDDLFLDAFAFFKRLRPRHLKNEEIQRLRLTPQRRLALLLPTWKEGEELKRMVRANLAQLEYDSYSLFLGVYTNDAPSWAAARELEKEFGNVSVIVNDRLGPTSRGQLLNEMLRQILAFEEETGFRHEAFTFLGAEEMLHPFSLLVINRELERADFVQLPLLSLPLNWRRFTAGAYADEMAESHTKDLLARQALGASPSSQSGGLTISRTLLKALKSRGAVLSESSSAENYHLGLEASRLKFRASFVSAYETTAGERRFVGARKYFPETTEAAIRQKARWTSGIAFHGASRFGWKGNISNRYFLWRDRRGPWSTIFLALASGLFLVSAFQSAGDPPILPEWLQVISVLNALFWARRVLWRMRSTAWVHGWVFALLVPLRWPVVNFLNSISTWRALALYRESRRSGQAPAWAPRSRRLPEFRA